jgi:hypothetical protein
MPSPTIPTVLSIRFVPGSRIQLTRNVHRALIGCRVINNHQLSAAGQAAFIAVGPMRRDGFLAIFDEHNLDIA